MKVDHNQNENVLCQLILIQVRFLIDDIPNKPIQNKYYQNLYSFQFLLPLLMVELTMDHLNEYG
jgi:hypothetical protein